MQEGSFSGSTTPRLPPSAPALPDLGRRAWLIQQGRYWLSGATLVGLAPSAAAQPRWLIGAASRGEHGHRLIRWTPEGDVLWEQPLPARAHSVVVRSASPASPAPPEDLWVIARRPGTALWRLSLSTGELLATVPASENRYFYGHAVLSPDGRHLLTTENDYVRGEGRIGIRDALSGQRVGEMSSHGIGPHELCFIPGTSVLVVANGGIRTHPARPREVLNLDTMAPNLCAMDWPSGHRRHLHTPAHHQLSVRHIAVSRQGDVAVAMQYEGPVTGRQTPPALALQRAGGPLLIPQAPDATWQALAGYVGSVSLSPDERWALATSPRGHHFVFWDLQHNRLSSPRPLTDVCATAFSPDGRQALVSNGMGTVCRFERQRLDWTLTHRQAFSDCRWDNHAHWH